MSARSFNVITTAQHEGKMFEQENCNVSSRSWILRTKCRTNSVTRTILQLDELERHNSHDSSNTICLFPPCLFMVLWMRDRFIGFGRPLLFRGYSQNQIDTFKTQLRAYETPFFITVEAHRTIVFE